MRTAAFLPLLQPDLSVPESAVITQLQKLDRSLDARLLRRLLTVQEALQPSGSHKAFTPISPYPYQPNLRYLTPTRTIKQFHFFFNIVLFICLFVLRAWGSSGCCFAREQVTRTLRIHVSNTYAHQAHQEVNPAIAEPPCFTLRVSGYLLDDHGHRVRDSDLRFSNFLNKITFNFDEALYPGALALSEWIVNPKNPPVEGHEMYASSLRSSQFA